MNKRIDIMCDLETLGKTSDCLVFQIAAQAFDITTGKVFDVFNEIVNIEKIITKVDGSTLLWWLNTDKELLTTLLNSGTIESEEQMFRNFADWMSELKQEYNEVYFWGNGILFDNKLVSEKMNFYGIEYPIYYRNDRDLRTIVELAALKAGQTVNDWLNVHKMTLRAHDALNDVAIQIKLCSDAWNSLI